MADYKFKIGDRVHINWEDEYVPDQGTVVCVKPFSLDVLIDGQTKSKFVRRAITTLIKTSTMSQELTPMQESVLSEGDKALVKAGFLNADLSLTEKAKATLQRYNFEDNKDDLVVEAKELLKPKK